jgi:hypothetical protein
VACFINPNIVHVSEGHGNNYIFTLHYSEMQAYKPDNGFECSTPLSQSTNFMLAQITPFCIDAVKRLTTSSIMKLLE